jgi:hypothetical protein
MKLLLSTVCTLTRFSAITALAFAYLPETAKGNVAFFYTAAALSLVAIGCWLVADTNRKLEATA